MANWEAILPKRPLFNPTALQRKLFNEMDSFIVDVNRECADYETAPSETYVRTNTLKRSWSKEGPKWAGRDLIGIVKSSGSIAPYNKFVRGRRGTQASAMARRGWQSIDKILARMWPPQKRRFMAILRAGGV